MGGQPSQRPARTDTAADLRHAAAIGRALGVAMAYDPDAYPAFLDIVGVIDLPDNVLTRPGLVDRITSVARSEAPLQIPGPTRQELLDLVA